MRTVETEITPELIRNIAREAHIERSRAMGAAIRALGRGIIGLYRTAWVRVRRAAGLPEPCISC